MGMESEMTGLALPIPSGRVAVRISSCIDYAIFIGITLQNGKSSNSTSMALKEKINELSD